VAAVGVGVTSRRQRVAAPLDPALLLEIGAALSAGASPPAALAATATDGPLAPIAQQARVGASLADLAATVDTGDAAADLLLRALAIAERTGAGAVAAVRQASLAIRDEAQLARLLRSRTAQARGTALVLMVVPVLAWLLLVVLDVRALRFYATPLGLVTGAVTLALLATGRAWSLGLVAAAGHAAVAADPLTPRRARPDLGRALALAVPALVVIGLAAGPVVGLVAGGIAGLLRVMRRPAARRGAGRHDRGAGGAAEAVELVAVALAGGLPTGAAVAVAAEVAPPAARPALTMAARRLRAGWDAAAAFDGTGLQTLGRALAASDRWGAPAGEALRALADDLRADRRAATEEAAERVQLNLVFPTTLLTLPAFVLGVVPPLLWTSLRP
jgi:Flp pilus assembly protein TadB